LTSSAHPSSRSSRSFGAPTVRNFPSSKPRFADFTKPRRAQVGDERTIRLFSHAESAFVDCTVLLVDEKDKNGISIDLVQSLGLKHTHDENTSEATGKFKGLHITFDGMAVVTWSWKEPPLSNHSNTMTCYVVPYSLQRIMLKATLFTPPAMSPTISHTMDAMVSTTTSPEYGRLLPTYSVKERQMEIEGFYNDSWDKYVHSHLFSRIMMLALAEKWM
jgi:hypothetical protein